MHLLFSACIFLALLQQSHAGGIQYSDCDTEYVCYHAHENAATVLSQYHGGSITTDAIVKIHKYSKRRYRVVIEASKPNIKSVVLQNNDINLYSCAKNDSTNRIEFKTGQNFENLRKSEQVKPDTNLKCESEFRGAEAPLNAEDDVKFAMIIDKTSPRTLNGNNKYKLPSDFDFCDPYNIRFKTDKFNSTKNYKSVQMDLNKASCPHEGAEWSLEYLPERGDAYIKVKDLSCAKHTDGQNVIRNKFKLTLSDETTPIFIDYKKDVEVRCVADAKFFCDYTPKHPEKEIPLNLTKSNYKENKPTKLNCPPSHEYFVLKGKKPIKNPKFECLYKRGEVHWNYNGTIPLTGSGTEVYCTDKIDCPKIPSANLHRSFLNKENMPTCHDGGQLQIQKGSGPKIGVEKFTCNRKTGKMYINYSSKDKQDEEWESGWRVYCHYEDKAAQKKTEEINKVILTAVLSAVGVFLVVGGILGIIFYVRLRRKWKEEERIAKEDQNESKRFNAFKDRVEEQNSGAEKKSKSNKSMSSTKSNMDAPSSVASKGRRKTEEKGIFSEENGSIIELDPPPYNREAIMEAYEKNKLGRYTNDEFPANYKMEMSNGMKELAKNAKDKMNKSEGPKKHPFNDMEKKVRVRKRAVMEKAEEEEMAKEDKKKEEKEAEEKKKKTSVEKKTPQEKKASDKKKN